MDRGTTLTKVFDKIRRCYDRGHTNLELPCKDCNSREGVEMHHPYRISFKKKGSLINKAIRAAGAKVIPLCRACHEKRHYGESRDRKKKK